VRCGIRFDRPTGTRLLIMSAAMEREGIPQAGFSEQYHAA
jgi:hypothetical protein